MVVDRIRDFFSVSTIWFIACLLALSVAGCKKYPAPVGSCAELRRANSQEVTLVSKNRPVVLLGPDVSIVAEVDENTFLLRNVMNQRFKSKYSDFKTGYYLFRCDTNAVVWQSADIEEAMSMARSGLNAVEIVSEKLRGESE